MTLQLTKNTRQQATTRVTLQGAVINCLLATVKIVTGIWGHSHALFADGLHSLADLIADAVVYYAGKYGNEAADHDHPYGHQRIETVAAVFVAILLLLTGGAIIVDAINHLLTHSLAKPTQWLVLWVALLSLLINEGVYRYTLKMALLYHSALLKAHAWHRRSDAMASLIVILGIVGTLYGFPLFDSIAAIVMGLLILKMAYKMGRQSLEELVDQGLDDDTLQAMEQNIRQVDGVVAMHQLRTRSMGGHIFADVHIMVNSFISVSEGHYIADHVYQSLRQQFPLIQDIIVHVDPEDDEIIPRPVGLPSRKQLTVLWQQAWHDLPGFTHVRRLNCHYIDQQIILIIALPLNTLEKMPAALLIQNYQDALNATLSTTTLTLQVYFYE